jgi:hypothetical protein
MSHLRNNAGVNASLADPSPQDMDTADRKGAVAGYGAPGRSSHPTPIALGRNAPDGNEAGLRSLLALGIGKPFSVPNPRR